MSLLVVGSVALDSIENPSGKLEEVLGGSATYFSTAASFFDTTIQLVAVVGTDFPEEHEAFLKSRGIDLSGLERTVGKTFRWSGRYNRDLSAAETLRTELNVYEQFQPQLPENYRNATYVFLANNHPVLQQSVIQQTHHPQVIACDTMNLWIDTTKEALLDTLKRVDILIINDAEAQSLTQTDNLDSAAQVIRGYGPKSIVVKKGRDGVDLFSKSNRFFFPAYLTNQVIDTTGAGDSFAGGFMGYLAETSDLSESNRLLRFARNDVCEALLYGTSLASFAIEDFSINRLRTVTRADIERRVNELRVTNYELRI